MVEIMLKVDNVSKQYKLGQIGGTTLRDELQRWSAKHRRKEDPTKMIGEKNYNRGEIFMALDGISFEVRKGERVGIIGHNGAGKSTLLKLISRVTAPTSGAIGLNGRVASMLEVGTGFHGELTGRENIYMNGAILGMSKKEIDSKMEDIIDFSECRQFIDTPVKRYSSGMYVKLAFSVAAHLDSEIMIMDEVLAVGDIAFQNKCLNKMKAVSQEECRTVLYVSHNMSTIRQLCERCIVLKQGKIIFDGDVEEGILRYVGAEQEEHKISYDFTKIVRPNQNSGEKVVLTRFLFNDKSLPIFERTELMKFSISFKAKANIDDLKFFLAIGKKGKSTIGLAQTYTGITHVENGKEYQKFYTMDISNLSPGNYSMALHAFVSDNEGNAISLDYPGIGIKFEILDSNLKGIKWSDRWYGTVRLNEIVPLEKE